MSIRGSVPIVGGERVCLRSPQLDTLVQRMLEDPVGVDDTVYTDIDAEIGKALRGIIVYASRHPPRPFAARLFGSLDPKLSPRGFKIMP